MSKDNQVTLTGNTGAEAKKLEGRTTGKQFLALTLYTRDSYKDENDQWQQLPSVMHNILAFNPWVIADLLAYKAGARLKITGKISYTPFDVVSEDGEIVKKYEATIIAEKVESAALYKKSKDPATPSETTNPNTDQTSSVFA